MVGAVEEFHGRMDMVEVEMVVEEDKEHQVDHIQICYNLLA